ncbi:anti-sigma factor antagonist [Metabacillus arenae]|uniref:Anti-sigma factor antagonist n=1 Tax=Metabacillus arenae TaxID=2771434 RepID=A0A926RZD7_9BACI|nr:anti-sigma factor antagonist [Metabacillus arenae]MBD1382142.1 anti-sigma factor antagonist [Metabacillus arenae]
MNIKIDVNRLGENTEVFVAGEIDAYTAPKLREELVPLVDGSKPSLVINLKGVSYMDSTGLGVLVGLFKTVRKNDGDMKLTELSPRLERLFSITGLNDIINISAKSEGGVQ